ncbi:unnamed protein product [Prorocentrum cordatum]|uniref:RNase H type-1 domain-containing protein n=1 Tax=Prorocentrum cordatum TaxID=2364126 RepID=A0ABN9QEB3_9DINO|nr:unnamed protein product [Polarella glacialis]
MTADSCLQISEALGRHPVLIDAAGISRVRRPRLYWCNFPVGRGALRTSAPARDTVELAAEVEPTELWLLGDACWDLGSRARLPAFARALPRATPPPAPAGLQECTAHERARWAADDFRFPPCTHKDSNTVATADGGRRVLSPVEREVLMGFWPEHTLPARAASGREGDNMRCSQVGNSFHVGVMAWLLAQGLFAVGLADARVAASEIQGAFYAERRARRTKLRQLVPLFMGCSVMLTIEGLASGLWIWQTVLSHRWRRLGRHINELEMQEVLSALKWLARKSDHHGLRIGMLVDCQVVLAICAKGRSSSHRLNHLVKRIDAQRLACDLYPFYGYVTSKTNPADAPSRKRERVASGLTPGPSRRAPPSRPIEAAPSREGRGAPAAGRAGAKSTKCRL